MATLVLKGGPPDELASPNRVFLKQSGSTTLISDLEGLTDALVVGGGGVLQDRLLMVDRQYGPDEPLFPNTRLMGGYPRLDGNGLVCNGMNITAGVGAWIPDTGQFNATNLLDLRMRVTLVPFWTQYTGSSSILMSQWNATANQRGFEWFLTAAGTGRMGFNYSTTGADFPTVTSSVAVQTALSSFPNEGTYQWIRVTFDRTGGTVQIKFWTSVDDGVTWDQLGTTQTGPTNSNLFDSTANVWIANDHSAASPRLSFSGVVTRAQIFKSVDGTSKVLDANFDSVVGQDGTTFTESSTNAATVTVSLPATSQPKADVGAQVDDNEGLTDATVADAAVFPGESRGSDSLGLSDNLVSDATAAWGDGIMLSEHPNLVTGDTVGAESGTVGDWVGSATTVSASTSFAYSGNYSIKLAPPSPSFLLFAHWTNTSNFIPIPSVNSLTDGTPLWRMAAVVRSPGVPVVVEIDFEFYDSSFVFVTGGSWSPPTAINPSDGWVLVESDVLDLHSSAPTAAYLVPRLLIYTPGFASDIQPVYIDNFGIYALPDVTSDISHVENDAEGLSDPTTMTLDMVLTDLDGLTDTSVAAADVVVGDTEGLVDNATPDSGTALSDSEGLTDAATAATEAVIGDAEGLTDVPVAAADAVVGDTEGLTDITTPDTGTIVSDNEGLTDSETLSLDVILSDPDGLVDNVATDASAVVGDTEGLADATSPSSGISVSDPEGLSDTATAAADAVVGDSEGLTDTSVAAADVIVSDNDGLTDDVTPGFGTSVSDNEGLTDSESVAAGVTIVDDDGLTDDVTAEETGGGTDISVDDPEGSVDEVVAAAGVNASDPEGLTDTRTMDMTVAISDADGLTDTRAASVGAFVSDPEGATDAATPAGSVKPSDTLGLTDTRVMEAGVVKSDNEGLTDTHVAAAGVNPSDPEGLIDTVTPLGGHDFSDPMGLTDPLAVAIAAFLSDHEGMTDPASFGVTVAVTDTSGLSDVSAVFVGITITEAEGLTDNRLLSVTATITDPVGLTDPIENAITVEITDDSDLADLMVAAADVILTDTLGLLDDITTFVINGVLGCAVLLLDIPAASFTFDAPTSIIDLEIPRVTITFEEC